MAGEADGVGVADGETVGDGDELLLFSGVIIGVVFGLGVRRL